MWRALASNMLTILVVVLLAGAGAIGWGKNQYVAEGPLAQPYCLQVPSGGSMSRVASDLSAAGAISNPTIYRLGADYSGRSPDLKAGSFLIEAGSSMEEIVAAVTGDGRSTCGTDIIYIVSVNGQQVRVRELDAASQTFQIAAAFDPASDEAVPEAFQLAVDAAGTQFRVVLAEGVTSWQVVQALNAFDLLDGEVTDIPAEGTLAPRDYAFVPGAQRADLLTEMRSVQQQRLQEAWTNRADDAPVESAQEALILASIIEKETAQAEERPLVASVFANRLRQGIKLQTDPTVIYGITEGKGVLGRGLLRSELRSRTDWNTYVIDGLPPTPIANPGQAAIEAALNPAESDFIFFVADGTGGHAFAETLDEHNRNVARWREIEAERAAAQND